MRIFFYIGLPLVLVLAILTYPGAIAVSMIVQLTPAPAAPSPAPAGPLPWLHVAHPSGGMPFIADDQGRMVLLHGAIPAGLIDFWTGTNQSQPDVPPFYPVGPAAYANGSCPDNSHSSRYPPLCQSDIDAMAHLGFNSVRLPLSWSLLEPERGRFSAAYLDRVAQVVDWARNDGMYVILDMHQNAYSRYVGAGPPTVDLSYLSGAPKWATITDGFPSHVFNGQRELNPAVFEADSNFWYDRGGIQDEYIATIAFLARRFKDDSTVAGYSVFNEPWPGWNLPPGFEDLLLFPFYRRVIDAITGVRDGLPCWTGFFMPAPCGYPDLGVHDLHHLVFLDTGLLREVSDFPTHLGLPVSSYPNLVLSMHAYTHVYTFDALAKQPADKASYPWGGFEQSYSLGGREARAINAALFVAEFGNDRSWDSFDLANQLREQERHDVGFAFWTWKENGGASSWGMFDPPPTGSASASSGCLRPDRERMLAEVYPVASADPAVVYDYDSGSGAFALSAKGRPGDGATLVTIPPEVTGAVSSSGAVLASVSALPDGGRLVSALPRGGDFSISVAPAQIALRGCGLK
ncbi:MAG: glycoside hydrolase family 5 protein [Candidatus Dormibacteraceae bacterium]